MSAHFYSDPWGACGERQRDPDFEFIGGRAYPRWANGPTIRSREDHPYSYSFFVTHGPIKKFDGEGIGGAYSDRMQGWDHEAWEAAWQAVAPKRHYGDLSLTDLSKMLTRYWGRETKCLQVLEGCNVSNGYPLWYFVWEQPSAQVGTHPQGGDAKQAPGDSLSDAVGSEADDAPNPPIRSTKTAEDISEDQK